MFKFNTAFFIAKEELPFTKYKGQLSVKLVSTHDFLIIILHNIYYNIYIT